MTFLEQNHRLLDFLHFRMSLLNKLSVRKKMIDDKTRKKCIDSALSVSTLFLEKAELKGSTFYSTQ